MDKKKFLLMGFGAMVLLQLAVPGNMIFKWEWTLDQGTPYKFRVEPVDPRDPFRGNYLTLRYEADSVHVEAPSAWNDGASVYVAFDTSAQGFVRLSGVSQDPFEKHRPYFQARIEHVYNSDSYSKDSYLRLKLPFERYFMAAEKAEQAEEIYRDAIRDSSRPVWSRVKVLDGRAVIEDVKIDGRSIEDMIEEKAAH